MTISLNIKYSAYPEEIDRKSGEIKDRLLNIIEKLDNNLSKDELIEEIKKEIWF